MARTGRLPGTLLVDGGCITRAVITEVEARGVTIHAPVMPRRGGTVGPRPGDSPAVRAWRARMETPEGRETYKARAATAEWVHADGRTHRTLGSIPIRGLPKVHTWALWIALAHNMIRVMEIVPHLTT